MQTSVSTGIALNVIQQASDSLLETVTSLDDPATVLFPNMAVVVDKGSPEETVNSSIATPLGQVNFDQVSSTSSCLVKKVCVFFILEFDERNLNMKVILL